MNQYQEKIKTVKKKAVDLYNKVPSYIRVLPDMKESQKIQYEIFELLDVMQKKLNEVNNGKG